MIRDSARPQFPRILAATVAALFASGLVAACGNSTGSTSQTSSGPTDATLKVATAVTFASLDPVSIITSDQFPVSTMVVESLTAWDKNGKLVPALATSWNISSDGLVYTFDIRPNVKFSDGEALDANAVVTSLTRFLSPNTFKSSIQTLSVIKSVEASGPMAVKMTLKQPYGALLQALTLPNPGILAPNSITQAPNTSKVIVNPVGTGPYVVEKQSAGDSLTLVRNDNYWGPKPAYKRQVFMTIPDATSRVLALRSGQVDAVLAPPMSDMASLRNDPNSKVIVAHGGYQIQLFVDTADTRNPALNDAKVRQALSYAIDRQALNKTLLFDTVNVATSPLASYVTGYCKTGDFSYNPTKAKQMLAAAGASNLSIKMQAPSARYAQDYQVGQAIAGYFRAVGVTVDLASPVDFPTYTSRLYVPPDKMQYDLSMIGFGASFGDAGQALLYLTSGAIPPNGLNATYYHTPQVDQLWQQAFVSSNLAERAKAYCQIQQQAAQDFPSIWLYTQGTVLVSKKSISGFYDSNLWYVTTWAQPS